MRPYLFFNLETMDTSIKIVISVIIGLVVGAGGVVAFTNSTNKIATQSPTTMQHAMPDGSMMNGSSDIQTSMESMTAGLQGKTGDAFDKEFLAEMIVHHQGAVAMAQLALQNASHTEIKQLASQIILAQDKEISEMQSWEKAWYSVQSSSTPAQ